MNIELLGWTSQGLRCPDIEVKLERANSSVPRVALVQMPNGTGKTTTLDCLRAAMDGSAESWPASRVMEFRSLEVPQDEGLFVATLRVNGSHRLVVEMTFRFSEGAVTYRTTAGSKIEDGYRPPPDVKRYLDPRFSELLFFNGELANDLVSGAKEGINAAKIIDTFYGLYHILDLQAQARTSLEAYMKKRRAANKEAQIAKLTGTLEKLRGKHRLLVAKVTTSRARRRTLEAEIARIETSIQTHLLQSKKFQEEEQKATDAKTAAELRLGDELKRIDARFSNPLFLDASVAASLTNLADNLDTLKLPEPTSRAFFDDLLKQPECICDRPMDENAKEAIQRKSSMILGDEINGFLNEFKRTVRRHCAEPANPDFQTSVRSLGEADDEVMRAQSMLNDIRARAAAEGDETVRKEQDLLTQKKEELDVLIAFLDSAERLTRPGDNEEGSCIDYFNKRIRQLEGDLAELTGSMDRKLRTDSLISMLEAAYTEAHHLLKQEVIVQANQQLLKILKYNPVQIADIGQSVKLEGRAGASVGQNLSVGYVFLSGLLHGGGNQFPLVVDSPAGALDDQARRILGDLLPRLVKQLVGFVIASERQWFVEPLEASARGDILFLTQLRLNDHTNQIIPSLGGPEMSRTHNGVVIEGRNAFFALGEEVAG